MFRSLIMLAAFMWSTLGWAADGTNFGEFCPTFFLDTTFGLTTYKSKLVESNDTGTGLTYAIGGYAGQERQYGFLLKTDTSATNFLLNESKIALGWQDSILRYRLGPLYLGVVFTTVDLKVDNQGTEELDVSGTGTGANLGFMFPIGRIGQFYFDASSVTLTNFRNTLDQEVKGGTRLDLDLGAYFDITRKFLDLTIGYRQRTMSFDAATNAAEAYYMTYVGFRGAVYF